MAGRLALPFALLQALACAVGGRAAESVTTHSQTTYTEN